jgi:hypothetical protein
MKMLSNRFRTTLIQPRAIYLIRICNINKSCRKCNKKGDMPYRSSPDNGWMFFVDKAQRFLQKTPEHVLEGINPGGIYQVRNCATHDRRI